MESTMHTASAQTLHQLHHTPHNHHPSLLKHDAANAAEHSHHHHSQANLQDDPKLRMSNGLSAGTVQPSPIPLRRGPWSLDEDRKLLEAINLYGPTNWVRISQCLATRTPKQCRERYHQNLKPSLNRNPISPEEGQLIEELVGKYGKRWAEIARHLNGRSDNAIKNWWNGGANRRRRASSQAVLQETSREAAHIQPLSDYPQQQQQQLQQPQQQQAHQQPQHLTHQLQHQNSNPYIHPLHYSSTGAPEPVSSVSQPAFNTAIFQSHQDGQPPYNQQAPPPPHMMGQHHPPFPQAQLPPQQQQHMLPPTNISRSTSINQELFQQQPGVKRLLEEQHYPARRHSAQTILTSSMSSSSPFSSTYSRGGSSRNSSVSFDWSNNTAMNSQNNSRRSSLAHEIFPNPLQHPSNKRQNSYSSATTYLSPNFSAHKGSTAGLPLALTPLTSNKPISHENTNDKPLFNTEFSFSKTHEAVKLPPPSTIPSNSAFAPNLHLMSSNERLKKELSGSKEKFGEDGISPETNEEGQKKVMNISNLLG